MNNQKGYTRWVIVILISVMAVGLVGAAWYYEENKKDATTTTNAVANQNVNTGTNTNTAVNINTAINTDTTVDDTSDWLTYTNDELGIQFQYPRIGGDINVTKFDNTQNTNQAGNYPAQGRAISISVTYSENSMIYILGSSSDFQQIYKESYNGGGVALPSECSNPGVMENERHCVNRKIADQNTYDALYYWGPECSPSFVRETKLNSNNDNYPGIRIHQLYFTDGNWDCTSPREEFSAVTNSELQRLVNKTELTETEKEKMEDFDLLLNSFEFLD